MHHRLPNHWAVAVVAALALVMAVAAAPARGSSAGTGAEFTLAQDRGLVGNFAGYGAQLNQHVYADLSGPPPDLPGMEARVLALGPQFVRIFFNSTEWTFPDRMDSFVRTVELAQRAHAQINITWQGGSFKVTAASMPRFADAIADLLQHRGIDSVWVTLLNEPNSTVITLPQYEQVYRVLDSSLRERGVRDRVRFMGGDLVGTVSPLGQTQVDWFKYMAGHMGDLLDAWSVHIYWDFWDSGKIDRRLLTEVRGIFSTIPAPERRPLYVTEFGVRGLDTFDGEPNFEPGLWPDGTPLSQTNTAAFQQAWFMIRAAQLGYVGVVKWDLYRAKYDAGTQDHSAIGPGVDGWPIRPVYRLLQLMTRTTGPGWSVVDLVRSAGSDRSKLVTAFVSPAANVTILGLDTQGGASSATSNAPVTYTVGGLPPNTLFRLLFWNGDGSGTNQDVGFLDSGPAGTLEFSVPLHAVFALTSDPLGSLPVGLSWR